MYLYYIWFRPRTLQQLCDYVLSINFTLAKRRLRSKPGGHYGVWSVCIALKYRLSLIWFISRLFGLLTMQVMTYFSSYRNDKAWYKSLVSLNTVIDVKWLLNFWWIGSCCLVSTCTQQSISALTLHYTHAGLFKLSKCPSCRLSRVASYSDLFLYRATSTHVVYYYLVNNFGVFSSLTIATWDYCVLFGQVVR